MFNIGTRVIVKPENKEGFINRIINNNIYIVCVKEDEMLSIKLLTKDDIELKPCKYGKDGYCNYVTNVSTKGDFVCICECNRE